MFARSLLLMCMLAVTSQAEQLTVETAIRDLSHSIEQAPDRRLHLGFGDFKSHSSAQRLKISSLIALEDKQFQELKTLTLKAEYKPAKNYLADDIPNVILFRSKTQDRWVGLYSYPNEGGRQIVVYSQNGDQLTLVDQTNLFSESTPEMTSKRLCLYIPGLVDTTLIKRLLEEENKRRKHLLEEK
jgi:hypothetical protein